MDKTLSPRTRPAQSYLLPVLMLLLAPPLLVIGLKLDSSRLEITDLVLTHSACEALRHHGAKPEPLDGGNLCALQAPSSFGNGASLGRIEIQTGQGTREVEIARSDVVSLSE